MDTDNFFRQREYMKRLVLKYIFAFLTIISLKEHVYCYNQYSILSTRNINSLKLKQFKSQKFVFSFHMVVNWTDFPQKTFVPFFQLVPTKRVQLLDRLRCLHRNRRSSLTPCMLLDQTIILGSQRWLLINPVLTKVWSFGTIQKFPNPI